MTTPHMLEIAGADIAYDVRGPLPSADGRPPLFMIGQPMDASGFETLASHFTDRTVATYDPRGLGRSVRKDGRGGAPRGGFGAGAGPRGRNLLKEHFLASDAFRDVYLAEYRKLYEQLYAGGRALRELERLQTVLASSKAIDVATLDAEANELRARSDHVARSSRRSSANWTNAPWRLGPRAEPRPAGDGRGSPRPDRRGDPPPWIS